MLENVGTDAEPFGIQVNDIVDIYKCYSCNDITIYKSEWLDGEERNYEDYMNKEPIELFGRIIYPNIEHDNKHFIPEEIYNSFLSSIKVKNIDRAFSLIGLRRTLEMTCKNKGYTDGPLARKLSKMANDGIIPPVIDEIAVFLKDEGNKAAHGDNVEFDLRTVNNMIEFTTIIMNYIYVTPGKLNKVQEEMEKSINK